jgi:acyl-coenzyme A synthetase/AMP-(fatty) acid ligase/acyl carrier protein
VPKGVLVGHGALANYVGWVPARLGLGGAGCRYGLAQAPVTDFGHTVMFTSLATGGVLHVLPAQAAADPVAVARWVAGQGLDYLKVVPSHLAALASGPGGLGAVVPGRVLILGGEGAAAGWVAGVVAAAGGRRVVNHYGPTETTVGVLTAVLTAGRLAGGSVPAGSPVPGVRVYVLDRSLGLVPEGVAGELFAGGVQLARGYAGRPGLTAERFVADPFAGDGSRMYRTGDLARWRDDGLAEVLGRADDQVKVRGHRVEPGEVEAVLAAHPAVAAAVVAARGDGADRQLAAWLVPADPAAGIPAEGVLRGYLGRHLPVHMIPVSFTVLAAVPLTSNGKLDRNALPAPGPAQAAPAAAYRAPATPTEELLAGIWAGVLGRDQISTTDSFFDLGGHSLLATQVISRIRDNLTTELPVSTLFDHPTIAQLAIAINNSIMGVEGDGDEYEEFEL